MQVSNKAQFVVIRRIYGWHQVIFSTSWSSCQRKKGDQFSNNPMLKMRIVLLKIFFIKVEVPAASNRGITKAIALPTAKRKKGNTRSVGVHPCQGACSSGA